MILTDREALLRAIVSDPADLQPRREYADWLEEHGDLDRSEFIRVQLEIAALPECPICMDGGVYAPSYDSGDTSECHCRGTKLRKRERELLEKNYRQWWIGPGSSYIPVAANSIAGNEIGIIAMLTTFRNGFVEVISCTIGDWLKHGREIVLQASVTQVVVDREPFEGSYEDKMWFMWDCMLDGDDSTADNFYRIPENLFYCLQGGAVYGMYFSTQKPASYLYSSRELALAALSQACIRWARTQAGLPELT